MKKITILTFLFLGSLNMAFSQCAPSTVKGIHVVQAKENLYRISMAYGVSIADICQWNNIKESELLPVCTILRVAKTAPAIPNAIPEGYEQEDELTPRNEEVAKPVPSTPKPTPPSIPGTRIYQMQSGKKHTVQQGETIAGLADLYGFSEKRFRELNALGQTKEITPGSILLTSDCACEIINRDIYYDKSGHSTSSHSTNHNTGSVPRPNVVTPSKNLSSRSNVVPYMKNDEYRMVEEINLVRSNPAAYVKFIEQYRKDKKRAGYDVPDTTVDELVNELRTTPRLSNLEPTQCLYSAASKHGQDIRARGKSGHVGSDGSQPWDRVKNSCPAFQDGNENLVGGSSSVRESVIILLIDNAVSSRGHRKTLLNPHWTHVACYKIGQVDGLSNNWIQKFGQARSSTTSSVSTHSNKYTKPSIQKPNTQKPNIVNHANTSLNSKPPRFVANASYMNSQENEMVQEVNLLRSNPSGYVKYLEAYKKNKKIYMDKEIDGLIAELKKTPALTILQPSQCVYSAAYKHGQDIKKMKKSGHKGSDGSWPWDRVKRSCTSFQDGNENLVGGPATVREAVILLLIDRGVASKGHRRTLLNPHWTHMAAYQIGQVGKVRNSWIQQFGQQ